MPFPAFRQMAPAVGNVVVGLSCLYLWVGGCPAFVFHLECLLFLSPALLWQPPLLQVNLAPKATAPRTRGSCPKRHLSASHFFFCFHLSPFLTRSQVAPPKLLGQLGCCWSQAAGLKITLEKKRKGVLKSGDLSWVLTQDICLVACFPAGSGQVLTPAWSCVLWVVFQNLRISYLLIFFYTH